MLTRFQSPQPQLRTRCVIVSANNEIEWANVASESLSASPTPRDAGQRLIKPGA